ncbi:MAG: ABC transporter permease [Verrucomicrobia bacterium]|nr:ABC transporter permease [Verrucomicrobiota bacterium]
MQIEESYSFFGETWVRLKSNPAALFALWILAFIAFFAAFGPLISGYTYTEIHLELKNTAPGALYWFGSDELGRDLFTRVWWGARISLFIGITAALIDVVLGVLWASLAAYSGGKVDEFLMRICDILYSIPYLLVVIFLTVIRGSGLMTILIAMTITGWINMARITRAQILQLKQSDYIMAAHAIGASPLRIIFRHLIPNALGPIIATMTLTVPTAIFTEAFLSFLGLGVQAPAASWGVMVNDGLSAMRYYPWRLLFPAAMITFTMLAFNLLGNALRDALDPRLRT